MPGCRLSDAADWARVPAERTATRNSFMAKINLRHKQRTTDPDEDGYFKYEPLSPVPPGTPGRHGVYLPKNWVATRNRLPSLHRAWRCRRDGDRLGAPPCLDPRGGVGDNRYEVAERTRTRGVQSVSLRTSRRRRSLPTRRLDSYSRARWSPGLRERCGCSGRRVRRPDPGHADDGAPLGSQARM